MPRGLETILKHTQYSNVNSTPSFRLVCHNSDILSWAPFILRAAVLLLFLKFTFLIAYWIQRCSCVHGSEAIHWDTRATYQWPHPKGKWHSLPYPLLLLKTSDLTFPSILFYSILKEWWTPWGSACSFLSLLLPPYVVSTPGSEFAGSSSRTLHWNRNLYAPT